MTRVLAASVILVTAFWSAACSGNAAGPDSNAVQVNSGDSATVPNAEIPTEFTSPEQALEWGKKLLDQGETEKSIDVLLQAVKMNPDLAEAYFHLGIAYSLVEAGDQSVDRTEETPTPDRKSKKPQEKKKNSEKAFESAVEAYKKILKNNEEDDVAHFYLGLTYNKLFEDEDAAKSLREAVKLKPDNSEYQTELGSILIKLAKYGEAVSALKKALELDPDNIDAQELLERAEAGKKRIEFDPPKKDEKDESNKQTRPGSSANSNSNTAANGKLAPPTVANSRLSAKPARTPAAPARTPRP